MELKYNTETVGDVLIFHILQEKLTYHNARSLKEKLFLQISEGYHRIALNLSEVRSVDSSGLGAMLFGARQLRNTGGKMVLVGVNSNIQMMIRIAKLDQIYKIFPSVDEAVAYFG